MEIKFVNFTLVFSVSLNLILIWLLTTQKSKTPLIHIYTAIVALFTIDSLLVLWILNPILPSYNAVMGKWHVVFASFLVAGIYYFSNSFTLSSNLPRLSNQGKLIFLSAAAISVMALISLIVPGVHTVNSIDIPVYSANYWFFIAFFLTVAGLVFYQTTKRRESPGHPSETAAVAEVLAFIAPLSIGFMMCIYILPFFKNDQPLFFAAFSLISLLLYICAGRYQLLEIDDKNQHVLPQFAVAATFMLIFYFTPGENHAFSTIFLSIPLLIACTLLGQYILMIFTNNFKRVQLGYNEIMEMDEKVEQFSTNIVKYTNLNELWAYLADFCEETFDISKTAIITLQKDVNPYKTELLRGFTEEEIDSLLQTGNGLVLEDIEIEKQIVNKFDLPPESEIFQEMDRLKIYLGVPLLKDDQLAGFILLGGERQHTPFPHRNIQIIKLMSTQLGVAVENIRDIETMLRSGKVEGLGMLASQVAHDFRSFMALTKNYTSENIKLKKHANYMERMVGDLLTYSRPTELKLTPLYIHQLIDMALEGIDVPEDIVIEKDYALNVPKVPLDIQQMRKVFASLIDNALRAMRMSEGDKIRISTRSMRSISSLSGTSWLNIEIKDEGIGIPEEFMERVFDPFFTTYKTEGGNGFGLAIVKQTIERHSGFIDVVSEPGEYTIFHIRLPYQKQGTE